MVNDIWNKTGNIAVLSVAHAGAVECMWWNIRGFETILRWLISMLKSGFYQDPLTGDLSYSSLLLHDGSVITERFLVFRILSSIPTKWVSWTITKNCVVFITESLGEKHQIF